MRQFAIRSIDILKEEQQSINDPATFDMVCAKYYEYSVRYCLNKQDRDELKAKFKETLDGLDIDELVERVSPLGFKFSFSDDLPKDESLQKLAEAVEEDEAGNEEEGAETYKKFETRDKQAKRNHKKKKQVV